MPRVSTKPRVDSPQLPPLPPFDERLRYRVDVAARYLYQSRATTWADVRDGRLQVIREGKRTFIPGSEIVRRSRAPACAA